jgi:hypothetical protein
VTALQITLIAAIVVPALAIVLWPLLGGRAATASSPARASDDRRLELEEEKSAIYRALRELGPTVVRLAELEGLEAHARSVKVRLRPANSRRQ